MSGIVITPTIDSWNLRFVTDTREQPTRGGQEDPVYRRDRRPTGVTPEDRELVPQDQNLKILKVT